jgi:hypothetical protein
VFEREHYSQRRKTPSEQAFQEGPAAVPNVQSSSLSPGHDELRFWPSLPMFLPLRTTSEVPLMGRIWGKAFLPFSFDMYDENLPSLSF